IRNKIKVVDARVHADRALDALTKVERLVKSGESEDTHILPSIKEAMDSIREGKEILEALLIRETGKDYGVK
ncbi:unnamed protein product, partial [marine sediment metagenome]